MRNATAAAVLLVLVMLVACGTGTDVSGPGDLAVEPCPEQALGGETGSIAEVIGGASTWVSVHSVELTPFDEVVDAEQSVAEAAAFHRSEPAYVAHAVEGELISGVALPGQAILQRGVAAGIQGWLQEPEGELLVGFGPYAAVAVVVVDGDDARFIGTCYDELMNPQLRSLTEYATERDGDDAPTSGELVRSLIDDPDGEVRDLELAMHQPDGPTWSDLDPSVRAVDPGAMPQEELAKLQRVTYLLSLAEPMENGRGSAICPRSSAGWSLCVSLGIWNDGTPALGELYGEPGETVEFWLFDSPIDVSLPISKLGEATLEPGTSIDVRVSAGATLEVLGSDEGHRLVEVVSLGE